MSPRRSDRDLREALLTAAARLLATDGPRALTTRRLAAEAGTSTMAVYTRFGSLEDVHRAVRAAGFERLERRLDRPATDDPVADLAAAVRTAVGFAADEPHLYRIMVVDRPPPTERPDEPDPGGGTFALLDRLVRRCVDARRFGAPPAGTTRIWAAQLWAAQHGTATLLLAGTVAPAQVDAVLDDMVLRLCVGYGDDPGAARASLETG